MARCLLLLACAALSSCDRSVDPSELRTARLFADRALVEIALGPGAATGDADHATVASASNGDVLVAFQVKQAKADSAEVHAVYFRYLGPELAAWQPSPTVVLAQKDEFGRGCGKPDVIDCSADSMPGSACFAVVWARRNAGAQLGRLESALLLAPSKAGDPARRMHSDGLTGFVLDAELDTEIATVTPDLVRHASWAAGRFGVVYTHRQSDQGDAALIDLRWREAQLPVEEGPAQVVGASDLIAGIPVRGSLYQYPGGVVIPDAVISSPQASLIVAHGESALDRDGSHLVLTRFALEKETTPLVQERVVLEPELTQGEAYLRRPQLQILSDDSLLLVADALAARPSKQRQTHVYQVNLPAITASLWPWSDQVEGQESPIAVSDDAGRVGVFFHRQGELGYGTGNFLTRRDAELVPLKLGSLDLADGRQPHLSLSTDPRAERGGDFLFLTTFASSERESSKVRRVFLRAFAGGLSKLEAGSP